MLDFSLVVPTYGRTTELHEFLTSLLTQKGMDFEVLIMDQNEDDRIVLLLKEFTALPKCRHFRTSKGASKARNIGLAEATGRIIAFPDDDCWYTPNLMRNVLSWFDQSPAYAILAVGAVDEKGLPSGNRWIQSKCDIRPINAFRTTFCSSLFIRNCVEMKEARFDEAIGPGTNTGLGGEETDYIFQLLERGLRGRFDRTWKIGHPRRDMLSGTIEADRAVRYGVGLGRILRRRSLFKTWCVLMTYAVGRWLGVLIAGKRAAADLCFANLRGLYDGFCQGEPQLIN
jgi:glycosyltransferase involved in cell wall biosynthesis